MTTRPRYGTVGMYPEPIPDTCYDARNAQGEFWDEWQERNKAIDADARRRAQQAMKDPNNTCGISMSPATAPDENDCYREIYEPAHDQMIRDLVAKYDCAPGGSGAATPASRDKKASGQSTKSNVLLYGIGALALVGIGVAVYASRNKYGANPVEEEGEEQCEVEEEGEEQCEVPDDEELRTSATISDRRGGGYYAAFDGKQIGTYGSMNEAIGALNRKMQSTEYYPNIYYVNERGNVDLLDQRGVVLASWV